MSTSNKDKKSIEDFDWDSLFPGQQSKVLRLTETEYLRLHPLTLSNLAVVMRAVSTIKEDIREAFSKNEYLADLPLMAVMENNALLMEAVTSIFPIILEKCPIIFCELLGLDENVIKRLPVALLSEAVLEALELNLKEKDVFLKNLKALAGKVGEILKPQTKAVTEVSGS